MLAVGYFLSSFPFDYQVRFLPLFLFLFYELHYFKEFFKKKKKSGPFLKSSLNLLQYCLCFGFLATRLVGS